VKNGVTGRVRSGLSVTELGNFCSREHPLREVISRFLFEEFFFIYNVCLTGRAARQKDLGNFRIWFSVHGFQDLGSQLWGLGNFRI
jgi:hypothetical protein